MAKTRTAGLAGLLALVVGVAPGIADEATEGRKLGWKRTAELSLVSTSGNSESDTFGFKASFARTTPRSRLSLTSSGVRAESTLTERRAVGTSADDFVVESSSRDALTAENYTLGARYEHTVAESLFWHVGATWEKNEFAGFSERLTGILGAGHHWWDQEEGHLTTDYAVTFTRQDDLVDDARLADSFAGLRLSYDYARRLGSVTELTSGLIVHHNLDEADDLRADLTNAVSVAMSRRLSLKVSLQALYDHLPALGLLPLERPDGTPTETSVPFELEELDTILTTALVVSF